MKEFFSSENLHSLFPLVPAGRFFAFGGQLIQLDRSRCQTHLPHEPAALFFILESLRFKIKSTILVVFIDHRSVFLSKSCVFYGTLFANLLYLW